jgi:hypothetical protein
VSAIDRGPREHTVQEHLEHEVRRGNGFVERIKYLGKRGCADDLVIYPHNRIYLVETKRPKGGRISVHQHEDANRLLKVGVRKVYLYTRDEVDRWIRKIERETTAAEFAAWVERETTAGTL